MALVLFLHENLADGTAYSVKIDTVQFQNIRDMYTALHHFAALMPQKN